MVWEIRLGWSTRVGISILLRRSRHLEVPLAAYSPAAADRFASGSGRHPAREGSVNTMFFNKTIPAKGSASSAGTHPLRPGSGPVRVAHPVFAILFKQALAT